MVLNDNVFSKEVIDEILKIIKHGNSAEVKQERDKLVVVELQRKVKIKASDNQVG